MPTARPTPHGDELEVRLGIIAGSRIKAWWYSPRDGSHQLIGTFDNAGERKLDPPGEPARGNDWVLVLDDASRGFAAPGVRKE